MDKNTKLELWNEIKRLRRVLISIELICESDHSCHTGACTDCLSHRMAYLARTQRYPEGGTTDEA